MFTVARVPTTSASEGRALASRYSFVPMTIAMPDAPKQQSIRKVNQAYRDIAGWVSSVGAGIAMADLSGSGRPEDLCVVDTRTDQVVVTPVPGMEQRYQPFALDASPLPMTETMAPMGCAPGDYTGSGRMGLLVYYWGRTPILFLPKANATGLDARTYTPVELVSQTGGSTYDGPKWNSNAVAVDDFDGDGHPDIYIGNYFPDSDVLDSTKSGGVVMNSSLSHADNGGPAHVLRWTGATGGDQPSARYEVVPDALPADDISSKGWVLASAANDLDGDLLPELYVGKDHGGSALLHNVSANGRIKFKRLHAPRDPMVPKSKRIGADTSFKGMGIDFGDLDDHGRYDFFVSDITTSFGIQESSLHFVNSTKNDEQTHAAFSRGEAPWTDLSTDRGTAWGGWGWDVKLADFNNSGCLAIAQTNGFVKGEANRWAQLQELATSNDLTVQYPQLWPNVRQGDDIAGNQGMNFFVKGKDGRYANVAGELGLSAPVPTRGIAVGDAFGDGRLDFAVARQFDAPVFYQNVSPGAGSFLGLKLYRDDPATPGPFPAPGTPVIGAQVTATTADGRVHIGRVDGGSGHSGKRSQDVHIGLGENVTGPVRVELKWRDSGGQPHRQQLRLDPGWHTLSLGTQAKEK
ncbi:ASPIC/UnbV domain-containing protein [Amycolatopsis sp. QT-25]|uniref:ASPIC/UnbV domain-containing protein n=1 Tax=Amycolatopsis sp. QT-25 TaxID=3034022 RepID=UPI0023ED1BD2|nr:ASPIC/UnbV domain-containing protein [Amycolatopsis sp. QT-25]WET83227.1 ASPIC/UnbV domain-containing protein [Amycolatopsis sp. QT-25]